MKSLKSVFSFAAPLLASTLVVSFVAIPAKASLLLEPYVGYQMTSGKTTTATGDTLATLSSPAYGARVGFSKLLFFVAADYMMTNGTSKITSQPAGGTATADSMSNTMLGVDIGIHIPLLQAYVGYMFMNTLVDKASTGDQTYKGTAIKVGAGFTGLPIVAINLDYIMSTYTKYNSGLPGATDTDIGGAGSLITASTASTIMVSVSAPFNLL